MFSERKGESLGVSVFLTNTEKRRRSILVLSVFAANTEKKVVVECFLAMQTLSEGEDQC